MTFVKSQEWRDYLSDQEGRFKRVFASPVYKQLTREDFNELFNLCAGRASKDEETAAVELVSNLFYFLDGLNPEGKNALQSFVNQASDVLVALLTAVS